MAWFSDANVGVGERQDAGHFQMFLGKKHQKSNKAVLAGVVQLIGCHAVH